MTREVQRNKPKQRQGLPSTRQLRRMREAKSKKEVKR